MTFTNSGSIFCVGEDPTGTGSNGRVTGTVAGNLPYYQISTPNCSLTASTENYDSKTFIQQGLSVTAVSSLTGDSLLKHQGLLEWESGAGQISFTMPGNPVKVQPLSATVTLTQDSYTYDGTAKEPDTRVTLADYVTDAILSKGTDYTVSYNNNINVGTATATITGIGNYAGTLSKGFVINSAPIDLEVSIEGWTYGNDPNSPSVTGNTGGGTVTYEYKKKDDPDSAYSSTVPSKAGSYTVRATVAPTGNYGGDSDTADFTITRREIQIIVTASSKPYDGTTETSFEDTPFFRNGDKVGSDEVSFTYDQTISPKFADKNVGTNKVVTFPTFTLTGADAANYNLIQPTALANITPMGLTISGTKVAPTKTYDGTTTATITDPGQLNNNGNGVIGGDTVTLSQGTAAYADKNVGTGKTVSFTGFTLTGADARNYQLTAQPANTEADITPKGLTISGTKVEATKTYDGTTTATITDPGQLNNNGNGVIGGDTVTLSQGTAAYADKNVGTGKTVSFTGFTLTGADARNYQLTAQPANTEADITPKGLTISGTKVEATKTYDGTTAATITDPGQLNGVISGDTVTLSQGNAAYTDKNVGTGKTVSFTGFTPTGSDAGNYTLTQPGSVTADITAKQLSVNVTVSDKEYDGTTTAAISGTPALEGVVTGDDVTLTIGTPSFEDKNVGTDKAVHFTGLSISGDDAGNYSLTQPTVKADITPRGLTISETKVAPTKTYDGTTAATITDVGQLNGVISGDTVTLAQGTAAYADKNVGNGKTVSFTGFTLTGSDAGNYTLTQPGSVTADITAKQLSVNVTYRIKNMTAQRLRRSPGQPL